MSAAAGVTVFRPVRAGKAVELARHPAGSLLSAVLAKSGLVAGVSPAATDLNRTDKQIRME